MSGGGGGSKLANLFGMDKATSQGGNESLTYTAPKQPKKKEASPEGGGAAPAILNATVVHAYKYIDSQYASQGKLGAAILGNHASKDYRVLLYVSKQQQVTNAKISPSFSFRVQANNYASFYDEGRQSWSVMFDMEETAVKFAKEVALSRANSSTGPLDSVVIQDLTLGEGGPLESGDSAEIKYTGWLLTNGRYGKVFDTNASSEKMFRFKLGKGKVIKGWDTGILGMKKGGKRQLVVPPAFAYGSQGMGDRIPANATLIFEVEVIRVKLQKGESPNQSPAPTPVMEQKTAEEDGETIKGRSKSITEHMSQSPDSNKAKLISRMAKMGQPMLPLVGAVAAQTEEEEETPDAASQQAAVDSSSSPQAIAQPRPVLPNKPAQQPQMAQPVVQPIAQPAMQPQIMMGQQMPSQPAFVQNLPAAQQLAVFQPNPMQQQQLGMQQQQQPMSAFQPPGYQYGVQQPQPPVAQQPYPGNAGVPTSQPGSMDSLAPVLLTESRQQNTEVRLSVSKMADKVDKILEKVSMLDPQAAVPGALQPMHAPTMETGVLLQNINRIVQENETLKKDVFEKSGKIETQNEKIAELLQKNQRFVEQSNTLLEERNEGYKYSANQSQAKVLSLEQEKVNLATELSTASGQLSTLQLELANTRKSEAELKHKLQSAADNTLQKHDELERLKAQHSEDEKRIVDLSASLREEKQLRKGTDSKYNNLQEEHTDLKAAHETLERNLSERKRKANEDRRKLEEEIEDVKINLEGEIQTLRDKLRKQKTNTDVTTADKVARLEEDIGQEWQRKCDKLLKAAQDKHSRALQEVIEEKEELQQKIKELESKIVTVKSTSGSSEQKISEMEEQIEELSVWKDKYDNLRKQATSMKERYEDRISDLEEERDGAIERAQELQAQAQQLKQGAAQVPSGGSVSGDVVGEVKKIMNNVYRSLREDFEAEETYTGSEVLTAILGAIKTTTLQLVQRQQSGTEEREEAEESEEDEEEEEEEEEEDEEEDEKEEDKEPVSETMVHTTSAVSQAVPDPQMQAKEPVVETLVQSEADVEDAAPAKREESPVPSPDVPPASSADKVDGDAAKPGNTQSASNNSQDSSSADTSAAVATSQSGDSLHVNSNQSSDSLQTESSQSDQPLPDILSRSNPDSSKQEENQSDVVNSNIDQSDSSKKRTESSSSTGKQSRSGSTLSQTEGLPTLVTREPPPLFDEEEDKDEDSPLFGEDSTVADTLGSDFKPPEEKSEKKEDMKSQKLPSKTDLVNEDDLKPTPPPPLFGDDDDEEDLDWLSG